MVGAWALLYWLAALQSLHGGLGLDLGPSVAHSPNGCCCFAGAQAEAEEVAKLIEAASATPKGQMKVRRITWRALGFLHKTILCRPGPSKDAFSPN
eukprot:352188-Chlamydomonas_euryale.AAC.3